MQVFELYSKFVPVNPTKKNPIPSQKFGCKVQGPVANFFNVYDDDNNFMDEPSPTYNFQVYNYEKSIEYHQETVVNDNDES